jgi:hypothetical protein
MTPSHRKGRVLSTRSGLIRLRRKHTELIGMRFDGTEHSARGIGGWLGRDTKIVYDILFTVIGAGPPTGSLVVHDARGAGWSDIPTTLSPPRPTTRSHTYERVPPGGRRRACAHHIDCRAMAAIAPPGLQLPDRKRQRTIRLLLRMFTHRRV